MPRSGWLLRQLSAISVPDIPWHHIARLNTPPLAPSAWSNFNPASSSHTCSTPAWKATFVPPPAMINARFIMLTLHLDPARSIIRRLNRSASAAIVNDGFAPTGPGITDPSATNRPL